MNATGDCGRFSATMQHGHINVWVELRQQQRKNAAGLSPHAIIGRQNAATALAQNHRHDKPLLASQQTNAGAKPGYESHQANGMRHAPGMQHSCIQVRKASIATSTQAMLPVYMVAHMCLVPITRTHMYRVLGGHNQQHKSSPCHSDHEPTYVRVPTSHTNTCFTDTQTNSRLPFPMYAGSSCMLLTHPSHTSTLYSSLDSTSTEHQPMDTLCLRRRANASS